MIEVFKILKEKKYDFKPEKIYTLRDGNTSIGSNMNLFKARDLKPEQDEISEHIHLHTLIDNWNSRVAVSVDWARGYCRAVSTRVVKK